MDGGFDEDDFQMLLNQLEIEQIPTKPNRTIIEDDRPNQFDSKNNSRNIETSKLRI